MRSFSSCDRPTLLVSPSAGVFLSVPRNLFLGTQGQRHTPRGTGWPHRYGLPSSVAVYVLHPRLLGLPDSHSPSCFCPSCFCPSCFCPSCFCPSCFCPSCFCPSCFCFCSVTCLSRECYEKHLLCNTKMEICDDYIRLHKS